MQQMLWSLYFLIDSLILIDFLQTDSTLRILRPRCNLLDSQGTIADEEIDQKVEFYFNLMLESLEELKAEDDGKCLSLKGNSNDNDMKTRPPSIFNRIWMIKTQLIKNRVEILIKNLYNTNSTKDNWKHKFSLPQ